MVEFNRVWNQSVQWVWDSLYLSVKIGYPNIYPVLAQSPVINKQTDVIASIPLTHKSINKLQAPVSHFYGKYGIAKIFEVWPYHAISIGMKVNELRWIIHEKPLKFSVFSLMLINGSISYDNYVTMSCYPLY